MHMVIKMEEQEKMKKTCKTMLVFAVSVSFLVMSLSFVQAQTANSWEAKAAMPTARSGFGVAVVNGKVYAIGGYDKTQTDFLTVNEMYDPTTNAWTTKAPMPTRRVSFGTAVYENKIYVFGGQILDEAGNRVVIDVTEVYDPATDTWATKTPMPHLGEDFAANVVVDKRIYAISNQTDVYDPVTDSWMTKTPIPTPVAHAANAVVDDKIYVISGNHYGLDPSFYTPLNITQIYDPKIDKWSLGAAIPVGVASAAAVATGGNAAPKAVYVVGGLILTINETGSGYVYHPQDLIQVYFPGNNSWVTGMAMPTARYALSVAAVDDRLYVLGGSDSRTSPDFANNELFFPLGYEFASQGLPNETVIGIVAVVVIVVITAVAVVLRKRRKGES
jgi:N-acetylneuraminic acid mutarotase